jgi:ergothioneine biosynthesis protein EgtB
MINQGINTTTAEYFWSVRNLTESICEPLEIEDYVAQPIIDVSPPRWHLAHTTWFFETFVLTPHSKDYKLFDKNFPFLFNSYYVQAGERWQRDKRGALTRPTVKQIYDYRHYVDDKMVELLNSSSSTNEIKKLVELGLNHEQQHQELLLYDIKYILGHNPLYPVYRKSIVEARSKPMNGWSKISSGLYTIGYQGDGFHFDNERGVHKVFLHDYEIANAVVSNAEYLKFVESDGYTNPVYWLDEGWKWVQENEIEAPLYWLKKSDKWMNYTFAGLAEINQDEPIMHVSFYEADAFARWAGLRLPTEFEWEVACQELNRTDKLDANFIENANFKPVASSNLGFLGNIWEWTSSAYRPYPFFEIAPGAIGEYNGKFMINQMVLKGGSFATSKTHIRPTYRNFFHPEMRWMFAGFRMARHS